MCQKLTVGLTKLSSVPPQHQQQQQQQSFVNGDHKVCLLHCQHSFVDIFCDEMNHRKMITMNGVDEVQKHLRFSCPHPNTGMSISGRFK